MGGSGSFLIFGGPEMPQQALVDSVRSAAVETEESQEDYGSALNLFQRLTAPQAVEIETLNEDFDEALEECQQRADDLAERLESVRTEADTLFQSWTQDLEHFSGDALRKKSEAMMVETQARAQRVITSLESVRASMTPVLLKLQDYSLFFRHNLNARAIATLEDTYKGFDSEFTALNQELEQARAEMATFLAGFEAPVE